jgi:hypothetical protein
LVVVLVGELPAVLLVWPAVLLPVPLVVALVGLLGGL